MIASILGFILAVDRRRSMASKSGREANVVPGPATKPTTSERFRVGEQALGVLDTETLTASEQEQAQLQKVEPHPVDPHFHLRTSPIGIHSFRPLGHGDLPREELERQVEPASPRGFLVLVEREREVEEDPGARVRHQDAASWSSSPNRHVVERRLSTQLPRELGEPHPGIDLVKQRIPHGRPTVIPAG
jgi:hypothetical protein